MHGRLPIRYGIRQLKNRSITTAVRALVLAWVAHGTLVACGRAKQQAPNPAASALPSAGVDAKGVASALSQPELVFHLAAKAVEGAPSQVMLEIPTQEPLLIATVRDPWACVGASAGDSVWEVHCTPDFRTTVAAVRRLSEGLSIQWNAPGQPAEQRNIPWVKPPSFSPIPQSLVSSRDAPGASCPRRTGEGGRRLRITLEASHDINRHNDELYLGLGAGRVLRIAEHWTWKGCKARLDDDAVAIECPPGPKQTRGRFWLEATERAGTIVRFEWRDTTQFTGAALLPCDARPTLDLPTGFSGGIHNYG